MQTYDRYDVIFYGELVPGKTREQVQNSLTTRFRIGAHQFERLFTDTPFLLKHKVNYATALTSQVLFEWTGLLCRVEQTIPTSEHALSMPPEYCNLVFTGNLRHGYAVDDVKCNLMVFLRLTTKRIDDLFVGHPVTLMRDVDSHPALKMQVRFELAGALCRLDPVKHDPPPALPMNAFPEARTRPVTVEHMLCPKCGFQQPQTRKCRHCGMYVERYGKRPPVSKKLRLTQLAPQTDAALKQKLLYWGIGFGVFGTLQLTGLGVWAMSFIGIGMLNLLLSHYPGRLAGRSMFLVNGLALLGSGAWSLGTMLNINLSPHGDLGLRFGAGHVDASMMIGGLVVWRVLQIGVGLYGLRRFGQYVSLPPQASSQKIRRTR